MANLQLSIIFVAAFVILGSLIIGNLNQTTKEGAQTKLPDDKTIGDWDTSDINEKFKSVNPMFKDISTSEMEAAVLYLIERGVSYEIFDVSNKTPPEFQANGTGKCMSDDGSRFIYIAKSQTDPAVVMGGWEWDKNYETCKQRAIDNNATVFSLQAGSACFIGNRPDIALGKAPNYAGNKAKELDSGSCGGPFGTGLGWTQNVYVKQSAPPAKKYRFKPESLKEFITGLSNQGYTDLQNAISQFKKDSTTAIL